MPKREHINLESLPGGCIFYAPLTQNDLTEHVSGANLIMSNGIMTWDGQQDSYAFKLNVSSNGVCVAYWNADFSDKINLNVSQEYTIFAKCMADGSSLNFPFLVGLGNYNQNNSYKPHINVNTSNCINMWKNTAFIRYSNNSLYYIDRNTYEYNNSSHMSNPANWNNSNLCAKRVCLLFRRFSEDTSNTITSYIKDVMIFNRALTAAEVAEL